MIITAGGTGETKLTDEQRRILDYAQRNGDGADITLAVNSAAGAVAPFIMDSDATVIGMGGFGGRDDAPSTDQLQRWVDNGTLRFILSTPPGQPSQPMPKNLSGPAADIQQQRQAWIEQHCTVVNPTAYGSNSKTATQGGPVILGGTADTLYHCG